MITGRRDELSICGSYVMPAEDGSYAVPWIAAILRLHTQQNSDENFSLESLAA